jgi:HrpA-like RNA helicase
MGGDNGLSNVTHIIIDEIHERDKLHDLLILTLRDLSIKFKSLKLIFVSAATEIEKFTHYFGACPHLFITNNQYEVKTYFLEDILKLTGYVTNEMKKYEQLFNNKEINQQILLKWCKEAKVNRNEIAKKSI